MSIQAVSFRSTQPNVTSSNATPSFCKSEDAEKKGGKAPKIASSLIVMTTLAVLGYKFKGKIAQTEAFKKLAGTEAFKKAEAGLNKAFGEGSKFSEVAKKVTDSEAYKTASDAIQKTFGEGSKVSEVAKKVSAESMEKLNELKEVAKQKIPELKEKGAEVWKEVAENAEKLIESLKKAAEK